MAKISVIMGIYNCASTLEDALDSLLSQTYTDWNCIMCDDGSKDNTYEVAKSYVEKYPDKFILIKNKTNQGLNQTLNNCLKLVDAEYVARMDGDDISLPKRFEKEVEFLENNSEYAFVSTPMIFFDENGDFMQGTGNGEPDRSAFCKSPPFCHAPCIIRKDAFDSVNGYTVSPDRLRVEDWDLWIKLYAKGYKGYMLKEPYYKMRDDRDAYKRRSFKNRINEAKTSAFATRELNLSKVNYIWCLRPIIVGLLPSPIYNALHRSRFRNKG